jgi:type IX secretion system PorP/SprF family membrane protein
MFNHLVLNPAYSGSKEALSTTLLVRNQWVSMPGAPKTFSAAAHLPLKSKKIGVGAHLLSESIGPRKWTSLHGDFAYRFKLGKGKFSFGLSAGLVNSNYDFTLLNYKDVGEVAQINTESRAMAIDASFGMYYYSNTFYAGLSTTHINTPQLYSLVNDADTSAIKSSLFFNLRRHYFFTICKAFQLNNNLVFSPSLLSKNIGKDYKPNIDLNFNFLIFNKLWLGASLRSSKNLILLTEYLITEKFKIGYAYDLGLGSFGRASGGSHEIMLGFDFSIFKSKMLSPRYL